jgi:hypothetical protein
MPIVSAIGGRTYRCHTAMTGCERLLHFPERFVPNEWSPTMAIDERTRYEMYLGLEQTLGTVVADALMEHLPPVGWADVATRHDLAALEERMSLRFEGLEQRFVGLDQRFVGLERRLDLKIDAAISAAMTKMLMFLLPTMLTAIAVGIAASRLS